MAVWVTNHFKAIAFRRWTLLRRQLKTFLFSVIMTFLFCALAIIANYIMKELVSDMESDYTFKDMFHETNDIVIARNSSVLNDKYIQAVKDIHKIDKGVEPNIRFFDTLPELNAQMYKDAKDKTGPEYVSMGFVFHDTQYKYTSLYNGTWVFQSSLATRVQMMRVVWKTYVGSDKDFSYTTISLMQKVIDLMFGMLAPMLIACGLISIIPIIASQPVIDLRGEVRPYMVSCTLTLLPYWVATYLIDLTVWIIEFTIAWCLFMACQVTTFLDNGLNTWYQFMITGPAFILFVYVLSFMFKNPETVTRLLFLILVILLLIPMIVQVIRQKEHPPWLQCIFGLAPHLATQATLTEMLMRPSLLKQNLSFYWKDWKTTQRYQIMQLVDIPIYAIILAIIEWARIKIQAKHAKSQFGDYSGFFEEQMKKRPVTSEAREMAQEVYNSTDYAVRIVDCSRLFFNTAGEAVPAVNSVTLGVKDKAVFGFLGANGAGKTTLIKMITSLLPPSAGSIEIHGKDISVSNDCTVLAICPQFNTHLCFEMTPREHFVLYRLIYQMDEKEALDRSTELIESLDLTEHQDKPVRELSGGNQRKLAVALSFFGPADIVLLDEPTSSLDPVARKHVHEMIQLYRGKKTFMLCTHLLSEAESLCDMISIMIKGCVYTCGSPQYLSAKFGTEYKIDVMLTNEPSADVKLDSFFANVLPHATLSILRPKTRIYAIKSDKMELADVFEAMEKGQEGDNGFNYFTCSSSSLERVFMEIVKMSEGEDTHFAGNEGDTDSKETRPNTSSSFPTV